MDVWGKRKRQMDRGRSLGEVVGESVQYNLTWTMLSSHSGAEFFSPGAMAEDLLRVTSEYSAGLHLGS